MAPPVASPAPTTSTAPRPGCFVLSPLSGRSVGLAPAGDGVVMVHKLGWGASVQYGAAARVAVSVVTPMVRA
jgi:hypothetical protein